MYIIGVTGGTGAGKSSAVNVLRELGAITLDCDAIYHEVLQKNAEMKNEIREHFDNVSMSGEIDRRKLGELVWNNPDLLNKLNEITHKYIDVEIDLRINKLKQDNIKVMVIDAIALIESRQSKKCDVLVGVVAPRDKRLKRIMIRDNLTEDYAQKRINAQQDEKYYRDNCDYILENVFDSEAEFEDMCREFFKELLYE